MAAPPASSRGDGVDRLSPLPDEIRAQILSFLPAQVAAQTCVLARSWRDVWKLTRCLRITGTAKTESLREVRGFVDHLLGLRLREIQRAPLDACEITLRDYDYKDDIDDVRRWISRAVECKLHSLRVDMYVEEEVPFFVITMPLVSSHLTKLVLYGVYFSASFADFSSCPALKDLEIAKCNLLTARVISPSLKHLSITDCNSYWRYRISVPSVVSLRLDCPSVDKTPVLEGMLELVVAYVRIESDKDCCNCGNLMGCHHVTGAVSSSDDDGEEGSDYVAGEDSGKCVLFGGLSEATNLTLLCDSRTSYLFRRDLRWCPTFWKLKTLVLDDYWCEPADFCALACILEHAPVLEKLTVLFILLVQHKYIVDVEGRIDATKKPTLISQHLKIVKVKCGAVDERVLSILNFLSTLDICFSFKERKVLSEDKSSPT